MESDVLLRGRLRYHNLSQILTSLNKNQKTGILTLEKNNTRKSIYLNNGNIIFASSSDNNDLFANMLLRAGKITAEYHNKSVDLLGQTGKRIGTILVYRCA